jgi:hypothetical protein
MGDQIGAGGFGRVYVMTCDGDEAAAKLVPKDPGADRELLFMNLDGVRNIVPIIDSGETAEDWVLVMPRADGLLRQAIASREGSAVSRSPKHGNKAESSQPAKP